MGFPVGVMRRAVRDQEFVNRAMGLFRIYCNEEWGTLAWYVLPETAREAWYRVQEECDERVRQAIDKLTS